MWNPRSDCRHGTVYSLCFRIQGPHDRRVLIQLNHDVRDLAGKRESRNHFFGRLGSILLVGRLDDGFDFNVGRVALGAFDGRFRRQEIG